MSQLMCVINISSESNPFTFKFSRKKKKKKELCFSLEISKLIIALFLNINLIFYRDEVNIMGMKRKTDITRKKILALSNHSFS